VDYYPGIVAPGGAVGIGTAVLPAYDVVMAVVTAGSSHVMYVFDGRRSEYVATPTLFAAGSTDLDYLAPAVGVNYQTGRFYAHSLAFRSQDDAGHCRNVVPSRNAITVGEASFGQDATAQYPTGDGSFLTGSGTVIGVDPVRQNLWIEDTVIDTTREGCPTLAGRLVVYRDSAPPAAAPTPPNFDAETTDIREESGKTGSDISGQASAFAYRYQLSPNGTEGPVTNVPCLHGSCFTPGCNIVTEYGNELADVVNEFSGNLGFPTSVRNPIQAMPSQYHNICGAADRVATAAQVPTVTLDSAEVRAQAIPANFNREWAQDIQAITSADGLGNTAASSLPTGVLATPTPAPSPSPSAIRTDGYRLPYRVVSCAQPGSGAQEPMGASESIVTAPPPVNPRAPGYAKVDCDGEKSTATGIAQMNSSVGSSGSGQDVSLWAPVSVQDARTTAGVKRDPAKGAFSYATTALDGISIGTPTGDQLLHIGRLEVEARAWAHGRPGTNGTEYVCRASKVALTSTSNGQTSVQPIDDAWTSCADLKKQLQDTVNQTFSGLLQIDFPDWTSSEDKATDKPSTYDDWVRMKSPGGYIAQVEASRVYQASEMITLNARTIEQPGLVVTYLGDTRNRHNRLVVTLGAVAVTATYGIYLLDNGGGGGGCADTTPVQADCAGPTPSVPQPTMGAGGTGSGGSGDKKPPIGQMGGGGGLGEKLRQLVQAVVDGFEFLWQHPALIPPLIAAWLFFSAPLYALSRRRALLRVA
jgi:hypothetical protein